MKQHIERVGTNLLLGLIFGLGSGAAVGEVAPLDWKVALYNPKAAPDDVLVPLPCGGAMAFRRVSTEADGPLADVPVEIGSDAESQGYVEHRYLTHLAGPFDGAEAGRRDLLIGKYEVTALQFDAVMAAAEGKPCPAPAASARLPKTGIGWHDAVSFAHRYSLWLRENESAIAACADPATPCLPRVDGEPAFARLPTEVEWEYAARGGQRVSPADFRELHYPMPEGVERHVWFNETAQGQVRPIGVLAANPLGLHDVLGNVEEITLEPFRLHRLDRPHGQAGGYVVRGGSIHASGEDLRSSLRREVPFYDDRGAVGTADTGFRVLLSASVLTSNGRIEAIQAAWERLGSDVAKAEPVPPPRPALDDKPFDDPVLELTALARTSTEPAMKQRLERLRGVVAGSAQRLYEQRARSAREALRFGGLLCQKLSDEGANTELMKQRHAVCVEGNGAKYPRCKQLGEAMARDLGTLENNIAFYGDSIVRTAQTYPEDLAVLDEQLVKLREELADRGYGALAVYPEQFHAQVLDYAKRGGVERKRWFDACKAVKEKSLQ